MLKSENKIAAKLNTPSSWLIVAIALVVLGIHNNQGMWRNKNVLQWDVLNYYSYLPATFIDKDLTLSFIKKDATWLEMSTQYMYTPKKTEDGKWIIKMSMGMAVLYSPFFAVAHFLSGPLGYESSGFSLPYQLAILLSGLFYLIIGLHYLRKILLKYYSEKVCFTTIALLYFGSNLLCYSTLLSAYSHEYNFTLFTMLMYFSMEWIKQARLKYAVYIGILAGLLVLIRPINILFLLFPLFFGIHNWLQFKLRLTLFFRYYLHCLLIGLFVFLLFLPQMLYWKYITGKFLYNSYVGENFDFLNPQLLQCLLGFRKGWFIYTPLMLLACWGIYFLYKKKSAFFVVNLFLLPLYFYVVSSWWCWWYGGSFGLRAMIDVYPLLALPLAAFLQHYLFDKNKKVLVSGSVLVFIVLLNFFQTIQFHYNILHFDSMTFKAYLNTFGKTSKADCDRSLLEPPVYR